MQAYIRQLPLLGLLISIGALSCDEGLRAEQTGTIQVSPPRFIIPKVAPGESPTLEPVVVRNVGAGTLRIINLRGEFGSEYDLYYTRGDEEQQRVAVEDGRNSFRQEDIEPEEKITFFLEYLAEQSQVPRGRITFETNDTSNRNIAIPIDGAESGAELSIMPTVLDFGRVPAGMMVSQTLTATNFGQTTLEFTSMRMNGSQDFSVLIAGIDPVANPLILQDPDQDMIPGVAPNNSFEITINYAPDSAGADDGELSIESNSVTPITTIPLTANGSSPCISVTPDRLDFGAGLLGGQNPLPLTIQSCGLEPLRIDRVWIEEQTPAFSLDEENVPPLPLRLPAISPDEPSPGQNLTIFFSPAEEIAYGGSLFIESNDPYTPIIEVPLNGRGSQNQCPLARVSQEEFLVAPLDVVILDGGPSADPDAADGRPIRYQWNVIQRPMGSMAVPVESFADPLHPEDGGLADDSATPSAQFFVDIAGEYLLELEVTDRLGATAPSNSCPQAGAQVRIVAEPLSDIHLQLLWATNRDNAPDDDMGADLDLHLGHPSRSGWFDAMFDCYYTNPAPDWGIRNQPIDDPSLDIDDIGGGGPENINLNNPENTQALGGQYSVGVHYFRATRANFGGGDYGTSRVTVRVYLGGDLAYEGDKELNQTNDFWEVGGVVWTDEEQRFLETDRVFEVSPFGD